MECPDAQTLSMYLDGELAPTARPVIESHLVSCSVCRQQVRRWETIEQALENSLNQHAQITPHGGRKFLCTVHRA